MWNELWRWQAEHQYENKGEGMRWARGDPPPVEVAGTRPVEPDRALFVGWDGGAPVSSLVCGLGLHETKGYLFLDDLTTNPKAWPKIKYRAVELALTAAQQYAVSVGKPICAFTAFRGLYRIAKRLGFVARPQGALLVFASTALPLEREVEKKPGPPLKGPGSPLAERSRSGVGQPASSRVPRQDVLRAANLADTDDQEAEKVQRKRRRA